MATKKEIKEILHELNLTESDMDNFWNDLKDINFIVRNLSKAGKTWRDMNGSVIRQIPTQKQRDLDKIEQNKKEVEKKLEKELKEKQEAEYYRKHFDEVILNKIDNHEKLTERELSTLVWDYEQEEYREEGDDRRWTRTIVSYVKLKDRYFSICWEQGLTECQENDFCEQPVEVVIHTYEKIIPEHKELITEWIRK